jgi:hypothetical protein
MRKIFNPEEYNLLASSVAGARVEAQAQYPSDVLASGALGNFLSVTIHDAFLNLPKDKTCGFGIFPTRGGAIAELYFTFQSSALHQSSAISWSPMANERSR